MSQLRYEIAVASSIEQIEPHLGAWWQLHACRLEDNAFTSPAVLPAIYGHPLAARMLLVFVYRCAPGCRELVAVAPFERPPRQGLRTLAGCDSDFLSTSTPLLHRDFAQAAASALWQWVDSPARPWSLVCWAKIGLETQAWKAISTAIDDRGRRWWVRRAFERPVVRCRSTFSQWLATLSSSRRGSYRAGLRRLGGQGEVGLRVHRNLDDYDLIHRFVELEGRGWKGRRGTAIGASPADRQMFGDLCRKLGDRNELLFVELELGGRPVAMSANFVDGKTVFGFKVAADARLRRCSPGILNLMELSRLVHDDPILRAIDSSADPDSFIAPYWPDRARVGTVMASTGRFSGGLVLRMMPMVQQTRRRTRELVQRLRPGAATVTA